MTAEQMTYIKQGLKKLDLSDDIIDEIVDHWACDIEAQMANSVTFEEALRNVNKEWTHALTYTVLWWSRAGLLPKIMNNRLSEVNKKAFSWAIIPVAVFLVAYFIFDYFSWSFMPIYNLTYDYLVVSAFLLAVKGFQLKHKNKYSSIYSFLIITRYKFLIHLLYAIFLLWFFSQNHYFSKVTTFWMAFALYYNVLHLYYHYKHYLFTTKNESLLKKV